MLNKLRDYYKSIKNSLPFALTLAVIFLLACGGQDTKNNVERPKIDLLTAAATANIDVIEQHIEYGTDINEVFVKTQDWKGAGALHIAAISPKNAETVMLFKTVIDVLLSGGADIDIEAKNRDGSTPLGWAAYFGKLEMVTFLVDRGADLNKADKNGYTPLGAAITSPFMGSELNRSAIIKYLKDKGAK